MTRRGSLSISTNAIVILIIAVIMLGLIIGLITRGFGAVEAKFIEQIEQNEPEPSIPSHTTPITLSSTVKIAAPGDLVGFKVNILNTEQNIPATVGGPIKWYKPTVDCTDNTVIKPGSTPGAIDEEAFAKPLKTNDFGNYFYWFTLADGAPSGTVLCRIQATATTDDPATATSSYGLVSAIKSAEFRLTIEG